MRISSQLNDVLSKVKPKSTILVSDGAEDEYIYPIISSRIEIDGMKRVVVKQAKNAENIYYLIAKLFHDEKVRRKFIVPLCLALIVFSSLAILTILINPDYSGLALPAAILTLGVYIIIKVFNWDHSLKEMSQDMKTVVTTVPFLILAGTVLMLGIFQASNTWDSMEDYDALYRYIGVFGILIWAGVFAMILAGTGRALQLYTKGTEYPKVYFPIVLSLLSFASLSYGITYLASYFLDIIPNEEEGQIVTRIIIFMATGIFFATLSFLSHSNIKGKTSLSDWHQ
jgi:putative membrane protein